MSGEIIKFTLLKRPFYQILAAGLITGLKFRPATGERRQAAGLPATGTVDRRPVTPLIELAEARYLLAAVLLIIYTYIHT